MGRLKKKKESKGVKSNQDLSFTTCPKCNKGKLCPGVTSTFNLSDSKAATGKVYVCDNCYSQFFR
ncbi:MAG: hypothetical protein ACFFD2_27555 [Promethearchaeota archaeon]